MRSNIYFDEYTGENKMKGIHKLIYFGEKRKVCRKFQKKVISLVKGCHFCLQTLKITPEKNILNFHSPQNAINIHL